jgi:hypothetical protein
MSTGILARGPSVALPPHHLLTHGIVVGMTGSGKTGLLFVLVEAVRAGIPVLMIDLEGDLPNLALCFDDLGCEPFLPWASSLMGPNEQRSAREAPRSWLRSAARASRPGASRLSGCGCIGSRSRCACSRPARMRVSACICSRRSSGLPSAGAPIASRRASR